MKKSVCILFGGKSEEYEVSLSSCYSVLNSINYSLYDIHVIGITRNGAWLRFFGDKEMILNDTWWEYSTPITVDFSSGRVDNLPLDTVFFPVMHGSFCEDGRLQGLFELLNLRYVGCDSISSFLCMDKHLTKLRAGDLGVPTVPHALVDKGFLNNNTKLNFSYPVFVKPSRSGSSRGASLVLCDDMLHGAVSCALEFSSKVLIEKFVNGTECEIGALSTRDGVIFSPVGSISYSSSFYDYRQKYLNKTTEYSIPAAVSHHIRDKITDYAKTLFNGLGCYGLSRLDFFVDGENIYFNEINTFPGFTKSSMYPMLFNEIGYDLTAIIDILIENAKI